MSKREEYINYLMDQADDYFDALFDEESEAWHYSQNFEGMIETLSDKQLKALVDYVKENGMDVNVGHDVGGIYRKERHFLPRIKKLADVTEYIQ